jgi:hypothetical protein
LVLYRTKSWVQCPGSLAKNSPFLYQANFAFWINGALLFLRGVRAQPLLIQRVVPGVWGILGSSLVTLDLRVPLWHPGHVSHRDCPLIPEYVHVDMQEVLLRLRLDDCIWDLMLPANLSSGCNYAEFPFFYLPPVGQWPDLTTLLFYVEEVLLRVCWESSFK